MTIIFENGDVFWIEAHNIAHAGVLTGAASDVNFNFDKAGELLGYSWGYAVSGTPTLITHRCTLISFATFATPITGQVGLKSRFTNGHSGTVSLTVCVICYLRRPAR